MGPYYKGDPRRMLAKFNNPCTVCGKPIRTGEEIIYWPMAKKAGHFKCYEKEWGQFQEGKMDEETYKSLYPSQ